MPITLAGKVFARNGRIIYVLRLIFSLILDRTQITVFGSNISGKILDIVASLGLSYYFFSGIFNAGKPNKAYGENSQVALR